MPAFLRPTAARLMRAVILLAALVLLLKQSGFYPAMPAGSDWLGLIAPAFYLWAFWSGAAVFDAEARKGEFQPALVRALMRMGAGLMLGAWMAMIAEPALRHLMRNGFTTMTGANLDVSLANLVLAFAGLVLVLIARRGQRIRAELDGFV
ncbi:hypothetical protein [Hyphobacterium sp.]|jgi:hypothetical protein|uniref:hypothetical protein n=1 Tax=Hyphobacterium sp. TaxID=2004662 RepID=UPI003BAA3BE7